MELQASDTWIANRVLEIKDGSIKTEGWSIETDGSVKLNGRLVVPDSLELKREIMDEAHKSKYSIHPGETKMYRDLKRQFWWHHMRRDIGDYVRKCNTCQQVKFEHRKPGGLLRPLIFWNGNGRAFP